MTKGVLSPWAKPEHDTAVDRAERIAEESVEGVPRREMTFDGRAFQVTVAFFSLERDGAKLSKYAQDALGRAIDATLKVDKALLGEFARQSIVLDAQKLLAPKVTVTLGALTLYVKASSFDEKMAKLMAIDRIALALLDAKSQSAKVRKSLEDHDVLIARKS